MSRYVLSNPDHYSLIYKGLQVHSCSDVRLLKRSGGASLVVVISILSFDFPLPTMAKYRVTQQVIAKVLLT